MTTHSNPQLQQHLAAMRAMFDCPSCGDTGLEGVLGMPEMAARSDSAVLLERLHPNERAAIERCLGNLIREFHFGYVLFGDKPLSLGWVIEDSVRARLKDPHARTTLSEFASWERLAAELPKDSDLRIRLFESSGGRSARETVLFSRSRVAEIVEREREFFCATFGSGNTPSAMLHRLDNCATFAEVFTDHTGEYREDVLGLLLGFSRMSVFAFKRSQELAAQALSSGDELISANSRAPSNSVQPIFFRAHPEDGEASALVSRYERQRERVSEILRSPDWLRSVLARFA